MRLIPVLEQALAKSAQDRHASALEMAKALRQARAAGDVVPFEPSPAPWAIDSDALGLTPTTETLRPAARPRLARTLLAAVAVAVLATGSWILGSRRVRSVPPAPEVARSLTPPPGAGSPTSSAAERSEPSAIEPASHPRIASAAPETAAPAPEPLASAQPATRPVTRVALPAPMPSVTPAPEPIETVQLADEPVATLTAEPEERPEPAGDQPGRLQIGVRPWAAVTLDGRAVGETPLAPLALPPGVYTARLEHPDYLPLLRKVTVRPGETVRLQVDMGLDGIPR